MAFSPNKWAVEVASQHFDGHIDTKNRASVGASDPSNWTIMARIYQSAVVLYCIASLDPKRNAGRTRANLISCTSIPSNVAGQRAASLQSLVADLRTISSDSSLLGSRQRKLVLWPLVIAGIELDPADLPLRNFVVSELGWISRSLGICSPLVAREFLEGVWRGQRQCTCGSRHGWDELFDQPYIFAM